MNESLKPLYVSAETSIQEVFEVMNAAPRKGAQAGLVLVVDEEGCLLGIATDGDIRKGMLRGASLNTPVREIMNTAPITVPDSLSHSDIVRCIEDELRRRGKEPQKGFNIRHVLLYHTDPRKITEILNFYDIWRASEVKTRTVCVVGLGYVGLTLAVSLADAGLRVIGCDIRENVVSQINRGEAPFHEPGLDKVIARTLQNRLIVQTEMSKNSDVYVLCVGTPVTEREAPNLADITKAAEAVARVLKRGDLVIVRSTVPVGTSRQVVLPILEKISGLSAGSFLFACMPERTLEGKALAELRHLPQLVAGYNQQSAETASNLFRQLTPFIVNLDSLEEAEMAKLLNNVYRDATFALVNEFALTCNAWGISATKVISRANEGYPRGSMPQPSPGVGGYCLRKDPYLFIDSAKRAGYDPQIIPVARKINETMPIYVARKVSEFCEKHNLSKQALKVFLLGFAYKGQPETGDTRFSTTLDILAHLKSQGIANIFGWDAVVTPSEISGYGVTPASVEDGFNGAHVVLVLNNHQSHKKLDVHRLGETTQKPAMLFDGWGITENAGKISHLEFMPL